MNKIFYTKLLITLSSFLYSGLCIPATPSAQGKVIGKLKIGVILPETGSQVEYGKELWIGIELAMEDLMKSNPDLQQRIILMKEDDQSTPKGAEKAAQILIKKRASLLIGSVTRISSEAVAEVARKMNRPLIVPGVQNLSFAGDKEYIYRSCYIERWQGAILAEFMTKEFPDKNIAIFSSPSDYYSHDIIEQFKKKYMNKKQLVQMEYITDQTAMLKLLQSLVQDKVEYILFPSKSIEEVAKLQKLIVSKNLGLTLLGGNRWASYKLRNLAGNSYQGHYFVTPFTPYLQDPLVKSFAERFLAKVKRYPSPLAAFSYDAMTLAAHAFRTAKTNRAKELNRALQNAQKVQGLLGSFNMNGEHFAERPGVIMKTSNLGPQAYKISPNL